MELATGPVKLKVLTLKDLDAVTDIDESLLGTRRRDYWEVRLERAEVSGVPSLAAELDDLVIGFILGSASGWEYGIPENVAWIDTLGVRKEYQKQGIARLLFREMFSMFKKVGVDTIYVFVNWRDWDLLKFFDRMGFKRGDMINLQMKI
jgi:ribosomal protein S18 acetylase RimI-like enzyme